MIDIQHFQRGADSIFTISLKGELTTKQYQVAFAHLESEMRAYQKLRLLFDLRSFQGWGKAKCWEDLSFNSSHRTNVSKIAAFGEAKWREWLRHACEPLNAEFRAFESNQENKAFTWIFS